MSLKFLCNQARLGLKHTINSAEGRIKLDLTTNLSILVKLLQSEKLKRSDKKSKNASRRN